MRNDVIEELKWRGLVNQTTSENIKEHLKNSRKIYCGFDPTGDSLHIGHLLPILILKHFENYGHQNIAVVGGATGLIGDPSGRKDERQLNTKTTVEEFSQKIKTQLVKYLNANNTEFVNNYDWFSKYSAIDFLRDFGKSFNINYMLGKESVSSRFEKGLSYTEFSYTIIQAIDFLTLYNEYNCTIQIGGSDQWGNITSGLELIRKNNEQAEAFGLTVPLITKSDGTKFGKTAGQAIWLNPQKTSVYEFYQFFLNTADEDVIKFLRYFTFLEEEEIQELAQILAEKPFLREPQKRLAEEITKFVHGEEGLEIAKRISKVLFSGDLKALTKKEIDDNLQNFQITEINNSISLLDAMIDSEVASSKREAREFLSNGAIKINGEIENNVDKILEKEDAIENTYILIKRGKKKYALLKFNK